MTQVKKPRGFAAMSPETRKRIQSMGGTASPNNFKKLEPHVRSEYGRAGGLKKGKNRES